ncbi:MAG: Maf family nucleotide pyrophosphatase [Sodaliphilus sp.]
MLSNLNKYHIILGSGSPRRKELLEGLGIDFKVEVVKGIEETYPADLPVEEIPLYLSQLKAHAYQPKPDDLIITADTVVILHGEVIGKPKDEADAKRMLGRLSGNVHTVVTGVTVSTHDRVESFSCASEVEFAPLTAEEIDYYVTKYRPFDKAGSYGIQEWIGYMGIKGISGSFYNVMGLPVQRLYALLKTF